MGTIKNVDEYLQSCGKYRKIMEVLRGILLSTGMEEAIKWGAPAYLVGGKNVAGIRAFKTFAVIWFFNGALLTDKAKKLINAQEGRTNALRQWRFESIDEIDESLIRAYLDEAIENQRRGKIIKSQKNKPLIIPPELDNAFKENRELEESFNKFSLSHKREYAEYISGAKRQETRGRRLEKVIGMILNKRGLNDQYR